MKYIENHLREAREIIDRLDTGVIDQLVKSLAALRAGNGRLFILGVGGGASMASHAVNDFRKIAGIEAYSPADNVSELTARTNDDGWETVFAAWLKGSRLNKSDGVLIYSVGGGDREKGISVNIVEALDYAKEVGAKIFGIVGRDGGYTARAAEVCLVIPTVNPASITPHTESFQAVITHLLVSHPNLKQSEM
ncbi:MAG: SIS domain-containing protein, partial [Candidatus Erginobacter occultus]|nr:SIS domain-containing protein [Candidatus Erginobacter occultus]